MYVNNIFITTITVIVISTAVLYLHRFVQTQCLVEGNILAISREHPIGVMREAKL